MELMAKQLHDRLNPRPAQGDRGSVIPLVALGLVMMLVMAAFAIDLGSARQAKAQTQSTTDAAALAGAAALGGRRNGSTDQHSTNVAQAIFDAASWAYKNLGMTMPSSGTSCGDSKTCYSAGDANNTVVEITTPYTPTRLPSDWSTNPTPASFLHVKTCYDNKTYISTVIGISSIRVCSEATARVTGSFTPNSDSQDNDNDPFARCATGNTVQMFDPNRFYPGGKKASDIPGAIPGQNNYGVAYKYPTDFDPNSIVFTIASSDNVPFAFGGQPASTLHEWTYPSNYITIGGHNQDAAGNWKADIKWTNFQTFDASGKGGGAKNFNDPTKGLPTGQYVFAIYVNTIGNTACNQTLFNVTIGNAKAVNQGLCQEDLFRGGTSPANNSVVKPGDALIANYFDETPPFTPDPSSPQNVLDRALKFTLTGSDGTPHSVIGLPGFSQTPQDADGIGRGTFVPGASHEYQWQQQYKYVLPDDGSLASGQYTVEVRIYDSDQNKTGGDCGYAKWTINFAGPGGNVELWD